MQFWYKAGHNVQSCYCTLSLWYSNQSATCTLDRYNIKNISRVLNGCKKLKNNYIKRHDRIVEKIGDEIKSNEKTVIINKTFRTALKELGVEIENENEELLNLNSDIIVKEGTKLTILDIACPCSIQSERNYGMHIVCAVVIFGSLRTVRKNALKVMIDMRMPKTKAKGLVKWCSTSNIISSHQIWNVRCKLVKEH